MLGQHFRGACGDKLPTSVSGPRSQVNNPVGVLDQVQVMFDKYYSVAIVYQAVQNPQQGRAVLEGQARGGLVHQVQGLAGGSLGQFRGQLHPLGFATRQGGGRLSQSDVTQAHVPQRLQLGPDTGKVIKELQGGVHRHVQHVGDALVPQSYLYGFPIIAAAVADFARYCYVGQELHFYLVIPLALAGLAPASLDVEREASRLIAAYSRLGKRCEQFPDGSEGSRVRGRVAAGRPADGGLVNVDHLVNMFHAGKVVVVAWIIAGPANFLSQSLIENVVG